MNIPIEHIDDLIAKVIAGEASAEETTTLESWSGLSAENRLYVESGRRLFNLIDNAGDTIAVDTDLAWKKVEQKINIPPAKVVSLFNRRINWKVAASFLLFAALSLLIYLFSSKQKMEPLIYASTSAITRTDLPDGSKVTLNMNSKLEFRSTKKGRKVKLSGEAFFEVKHDADKPFVIIVDEVMVKDIGTAFNLKALPTSNVVEVSVEEGEVQFYSNNSEGLFLVKGEKASYDKTTGVFAKQLADPSENSHSYSTRIFHFTETPLREVIRQVNAVYGSQVSLAKEEIGNCRLSVTFNNEDLEVLIGVIAETLDLKIESSGDKILLNGNACND